jgi:microcystin-dependent protein
MASDTYSAILGLLEQGTGNNNNTWGTLLNTGVMDKVDLAVAGYVTTAVTGGTLDLSASPPPAGPSGAIQAILAFTGTLGSNQIVKVPNLSKIWLVNNQCTGAFTLTFKTPSGSASAAIPQSGWALVWCDGSNNISIGISTTATGVQFLAPDGTLAAPGISFASEPGTGIRRKGTNDITIDIGGVDVVEITGAGAGTPNIVNVLSPAVLQVNGVAPVPPGVEQAFAGVNAPTGWLLEYGQAVSRTTYANLFAVICPNQIGGTTITGTTHTNTTIDGLSVDLRGLGVEGAFIEGTGLSTGTSISSVNSASSMTISPAASGSASGLTFRILPYGQADGSTTFSIPDRRGRIIPGRDNMGGTAAGRLPGSVAGSIIGTKLSSTGGEEAHTLTNTETAAHNHAVFAGVETHVHNDGTLSVINNGTGGAINNVLIGANTSGNANTQPAATGITVRDTAGGGGTANQTSSGGGTVPVGGAAHNNVMPAGISNMIIKT